MQNNAWWITELRLISHAQAIYRLSCYCEFSNSTDLKLCVTFTTHFLLLLTRDLPLYGVFNNICDYSVSVGQIVRELDIILCNNISLCVRETAEIIFKWKRLKSVSLYYKKYARLYCCHRFLKNTYRVLIGIV